MQMTKQEIEYPPNQKNQRYVLFVKQTLFQNVVKLIFGIGRTDQALTATVGNHWRVNGTYNPNVYLIHSTGKKLYLKNTNSS